MFNKNVFLDLKAMFTMLGEKLAKIEQTVGTGQDLSFTKTNFLESSIPSSESVSLPNQSISNDDLNSKDDVLFSEITFRDNDGIVHF